MTIIRGQKSIGELKRELHQVRCRLVELHAQFDDIRLRLKPAVEMEYALKIGVWETECAKADLCARRLKRMCELAQTRVNHGQSIDWDAIDLHLDAELEEWIAGVNACVASLQAHMDQRATMGFLSAADAHELKMLHRKLVKRLHPDLNPDNPEAHRYFALVQAAYENGDLAFLRSLDVATAGFDAGEREDEGDEDSLHVDIELASAQVAFMEERIEREMSEKPYVFRDLLKDAIWVESKVAPLRARIEELREVQQVYKQRIEMLKEAGNGW